MRFLAGVEFFESRAKLENRRNLDAQLAKATTIYAILIVGRKIREQQLLHIRNIRKAILPDPYSRSFAHYAKTVGEENHLEKYVVETTTYLTKEGIEVKWYPHVICNSV